MCFSKVNSKLGGGAWWKVGSDTADKSSWTQGSARRLNLSLDERTKWRLIRIVVVLIFALLASIGGFVYSHYRSIQTETSLPVSKSSPSPPTTSSPTSAPNYRLTRSVNPLDAGQIPPSPDMETYPDGTPVTLTAIPNNDCYTFGRWKIGDTLAWGENITITMDSDKSVTHDFKKKDTIPPVILDVAVVHAKTTDRSATITWETDEPATSQVAYGKTEAPELKPTPIDENHKTSHSIRITELESNAIYHFKVMSKDKCGNEETSSTKKLTTLSKIPDGYEVGKRPPDFKLQEYQDDNPKESPNPNNGEWVSLSDYQGKKILLNFWNTFCGACIGEFPLIRGIYNGDDCKQNEGNLAVITICIDSRIDEAADRIKILEDKYSDEAGPFTFPILLDTEENSAKASYHIWTIPKTVFIDSDGIIRGIRVGRFENMADINKFISDSSK